MEKGKKIIDIYTKEELIEALDSLHTKALNREGCYFSLESFIKNELKKNK